MLQIRRGWQPVSLDSISRQQAATELAARRSARNRLFDFTRYIHPEWVTGRHHKIICEALERVERGECKRLIIETPPRHSKSELASKKFPAWYLGRNPTKQIITASYNDELATDFGREVRNTVRDELYARVFPGIELAPDSTAAGRWHTNKGGVYVASGVGGSITGRGAHLAIVDDPIKNRDEADSARIRDRVWKWYTSTLVTRLMPGGAIVLIMTRWHADDLVGRALESEQWERVTLPAIANEHTPDEQALWPEWYPLESLRNIRELMVNGGRARDWHALYQQSPTNESGDYMRASWFEQRHEFAPPGNIYMASDFATKGAQEGTDPDLTEHGVFSVAPGGKVYVLDWWRGQATPDQWIEQLLNLARRHKPLCWFGEGGVIRHAVEPLMIRMMRESGTFFRREWVNPIHDKATRGRSFQGRAAAGMVSFPCTPWAEDVIRQCVGFGTGSEKHDDAFDVMSLIMRCIDQAHPGIAVPDEAKMRRRDAYDVKPAGDSWRLA